MAYPCGGTSCLGTCWANCGFTCSGGAVGRNNDSGNRRQSCPSGGQGGTDSGNDTGDRICINCGHDCAGCGGGCTGTTKPSSGGGDGGCSCGGNCSGGCKGSCKDTCNEGCTGTCEELCNNGCSSSANSAAYERLKNKTLQGYITNEDWDDMSSILRQCLNCKLKKKNGERPENEYSIGELDYITGSLIKTLIGRLKEVNVNATTSETNNGISYSLFPLDFAQKMLDEVIDAYSIVFPIDSKKKPSV